VRLKGIRKRPERLPTFYLSSSTLAPPPYATNALGVHHHAKNVFPAARKGSNDRGNARPPNPTGQGMDFMHCQRVG